MPISERKLQANRANAQKSTGPNTTQKKGGVSLCGLVDPLVRMIKSHTLGLLLFAKQTHFPKITSLRQKNIEENGFLA